MKRGIQPTEPDRPLRHVAVIMDGNGRWAKERGLPRLAGHRSGADAAVRAVDACPEFGIEFLTLYAFSTENWRRPRAEVEGLMKMLEQFLRTKGPEFDKRNVRLQTIGRTDDLPRSCRAQLDKLIARTSGNTGLRLILALSYSGRSEIADAARRIAVRALAGEIQPDQIDEDAVAAHLYTVGLPDPDLLIRTSGELRISNFLLWQLSYTEIHVTPVLWPDFSREHLATAVQDYRQRHRRFGAL